MNQPPVALVKTWVHLASSKESADVRKRALEMLLGAFGDMREVVEFCRQHKIEMKAVY